MKATFQALLIVATVLSSRAADSPGANGWSEAVNGLQARLVFGERHTQAGAQIPEVYLELHNVSDRGNLMELDFCVRESMRFQLRSAGGQAAPKPAGIAIDGALFCHSPQHIELPNDGILKFPVSCHTIVTGAKSATVFQFDSPSSEAIWEVPVGDTNVYIVTSTLTIPKTPRNLNSSNWRWDGTINIPALTTVVRRVGEHE